MESSSMKSPYSHKDNLKTSSSKISNRLSSAIKDRTCPICLSHIAGHRPAIISPCLHAYCLSCLLRWSNHKRLCPLCNSPFDSYFSSTSYLLSQNTFHKHRLLPLKQPSINPPGRREVEILSPRALQRALRRTREEINAVNRRSRPVPRQRSFGRLGSVPSEVIAERVLQWRASIYKLGLKAVPFTDKNLSNLNMKTSTSHKEVILSRIEPWIRRELQAILEDPDPTIIVHVVTSLYLSSMEKQPGASLRCPDTNDTSLASLQPFLNEWTTTFWHELRCFAECSFSMNTYDEVVEYRKSE